jgi:quinoprotein glucose dehydrogenase
MPRRFLALAAPVALAAGALAVPPAEQQGAKAAPAADAEQAAKRAQIEGGLTATVWAAEPLLKNPVAFAFDPQGKCYVAETERLHDGVPDTRGFMHWLDDDIGARTVADRLALYKKHHYPDFSKYGERLRLVWDADGKGRATDARDFAGPFNKPEDGIAAGVLATHDAVYFGCIPSVYKYDAAGKQTVLSTGYGVRNQFIGHDLHGLIFGPDGRLYFSIGDRGFTVTTREGKALSNPDSGAVLRCDPDGANLEVVHTGLRNPQELAFDDLGNLFTWDNNSDSGDRARWVQVVEGGDSGWRCGYQYGTLMHHPGVPQGNRGPWNTEKIWHVPGPDGSPPAYVVPPLAHFGNGPSGLAAYPGVGLGDRYRGHFFACDFTAQPGNSVIWSLAVKPKGASFEVTDLHKFVTNMVPTDCEFGPDGAFYWLDWLGGWGKSGKGRVFRVADEQALKNPAIAEAKALLAEGFAKKTADELAKLLGHPHRGVRQGAQFELVKRPEAVVTFEKLLRESKDRTPRLHAVWGLSRRVVAGRLQPFLDDPDPEVRVNIARGLVYSVLGYHAGAGEQFREEEKRWNSPAFAGARKLLTDAEPRVRAAAAVTYGELCQVGMWGIVTPGAAPHLLAPLFDVLKSDASTDPYIRQATVEGLVRATPNPDDLFNAWKLSKQDAPAVRLGVVLALRRLQGKHLADFLADPEPAIVAEAARAIYDQGLMPAMEPLAKLADRAELPEPVAYRALAANYKLGGAANAARVASFAARPGELPHLREAALKLLADWTKPKRLDPITGLRQSLPERPAAEAATAIAAVLPKLFAGPDAVRKQAVAVTAKLGVKEVGPLLNSLVADGKQPAVTRAEALFALQDLKAAELSEAVGVALKSDEPKLKAAARVAKAQADPKTAAAELGTVALDAAASAAERQLAVRELGEQPEAKPADEALVKLLDEYAAGKLPADLKLDVLEAAGARATAENRRLYAPLRAKLKAIDHAARAAEGQDHLARYRESLSGGDADKGREQFVNNAAVYCQRCHMVGGQGGEVGPKLDGIGAKHPRDYLLEAIVHPNAKIAEGYQSVILSLADGRTVSGVLRAKTATEYTLVTPDNKVVTVPKDDVDAEKPDQSAMPADLIKKLSKRELRDLVEFLASLKEGGK